MKEDLDLLCINTIRMLSADAVEKAASGHPGLPMGAATFTYTLWEKFLRFNPKNPNWPNRDRFVLSAGHGSMLLYSLLHLSGYDLSLDDIKNFRQWDSKAAGHPEHGLAPGVETTTGPLGQGFANAIGMAMAEKFMAKRFNRPGHEVINYRTYALVSDGDLMEGISSEAASYAGKMKLGNAIFLYDDNNISIEGSTDISFREDTAKRFDAYGWQTIPIDDGNDIELVASAIEKAQKDERPSLLLIKTKIGFGSPNKQGKASVHGAPLGAEELIKTKENIGWPTVPTFYIPEHALKHMRKNVEKGRKQEELWNKIIDSYTKEYPELVEQLEECLSGKLPNGWDKDLPNFKSSEKAMATREASGVVMNAIAPNLPFFFGGSADLGPSNNTNLNDFGDVTADNWDENARNLHFGVREHAMAGILNGLALSKGFLPYGATFLIFSDYMRGSLRLSALMNLPVTYVLTHDSIGQGEDGATHQPVEHLASLRSIPDLTVIRPSDATEVAEAWRQIINGSGPHALILSRQKLPIIDRNEHAPADGLSRGAYILKDTDENPDLIIIASGSEVSLALEASEELKSKKIKARVVSFPSWELFEKQSEKYREKVLPKHLKKRLIVEAGSSFGWSKYATDEGDFVSVDKFGASAPGPIMMEKFGFTVENIVRKAKKLVG